MWLGDKSIFIVRCKNEAYVSMFVDMSGIIPEDEDEQDMYDDVGAITDAMEAEPIDDDLYEELPGLIKYIITLTELNNLWIFI